MDLNNPPAKEDDMNTCQIFAQIKGRESLIATCHIDDSGTAVFTIIDENYRDVIEGLNKGLSRNLPTLGKTIIVYPHEGLRYLIALEDSFHGHKLFARLVSAHQAAA